MKARMTALLRKVVGWICPLLVASVVTANASAVQVELAGLTGALHDAVRVSLDISAEAARERVSVARLRRTHAAAPHQIAAALEASGYYRSTVSASLTKTNTGWQARYEVQRGPPLRVSELQVTVNGPAETDLALGRYLTPRLYIGYGLALAEQTNAVTLRYMLSEHWLLEVLSGLTQTADFLYKIER